ncbi:hypothetical protein F8M41_004747 [Gigaspora margarita]|uniref:Uncharacterized protein n=1 Tax=Gigaspora margarita TaxID=4874 RepID=A0A8H3X9Y1_GIGMA|nr:hypothetical protein F8M41_004747 [Gigaspora margarita]
MSKRTFDENAERMMNKTELDKYFENSSSDTFAKGYYGRLETIKVIEIADETELLSFFFNDSRRNQWGCHMARVYLFVITNIMALSTMHVVKVQYEPSGQD